MALETYSGGLLTVEQAAAYLNLSPQTLRNWRVAGEGPKALKVGASLVRYRQVELDRWLEAENSGNDPR